MDNTDSFTVERFYPHSPEDVWTAVNSPELFLADWVLGLEGPIAEPGTSLSLKVLPLLGSGFTGHVICWYRDVRPHELITFQFIFDGAKQSVLEGKWEFAKCRHGTFLSCTLSGFTPGRPSHSRTRYMLKNAMEQVLWRLSTFLNAENNDLQRG
ncbi:hypothetical protein DE4585_03879 [Mycobacteroides salmoniphilum]|uniref:Activator of Hsp90 ATPase homologue 1/2-like C-terminal domain-containing protein n=1 Tax=Mycobacteroides salmoniphilum TaxID=404941 RepID=A0A4V6QF53_9MYCO|nr:SRPBCC domain-containing protein [Mycobacteroides salmoniphilum]TDZ80128.1 hypothetical protein DE4585_03879 [Mycobacteroides salmoniphilum]